MEFWGVEVKPGHRFKLDPKIDGKLAHLSQASLGKVKKDTANDSIHLFVKVGDQKLVIGTLSADEFPDKSFDLFFEKEFALSHDCKNGSVYFFGYYRAEEPEEFTDTGSDSDEKHGVLVEENGNEEFKDEKQNPVAVKANAAKSELSDAKSPVKKSSDDSKDDESEDDSDDESEEDGSNDESEDDDSDDDMPKIGEKTTGETASKTPTPEEKFKQSGIKSGTDSNYAATLNPSKEAGGKHGNDSNSNLNSTKPGGEVTCTTHSKLSERNEEVSRQRETKDSFHCTWENGVPLVTIPEQVIQAGLSYYKFAILFRFVNYVPKLEWVTEKAKEWDLKFISPLSLTRNETYILRLGCKEDQERVLLSRPLMVGNKRVHAMPWFEGAEDQAWPVIVPIWITISGLPIYLMSKDILFWLAKIVGTPIKLDTATANGSHLILPKILVDIDLNRELPSTIKAQLGNQREAILQVVYEPLPCKFCLRNGHSAAECYYRPV